MKMEENAMPMRKAVRRNHEKRKENATAENTRNIKETKRKKIEGNTKKTSGNAKET